MSTTTLTDADEMATAPLTFSYQVTGTVSFNTTVSGDARQVAAISIMYGSAMMWNATLTQAEPTATLGADVKIGTTTVKAGATFTLTIPTASTLGMVMVDCTIVSPNNPTGTPFQAPIANWQLVSAV